MGFCENGNETLVSTKAVNYRKAEQLSAFIEKTYRL
jgi:hypothetical protein